MCLTRSKGWICLRLEANTEGVIARSSVKQWGGRLRNPIAVFRTKGAPIWQELPEQPGAKKGAR